MFPLGGVRDSRAFLNVAQLIWNSPVGAPSRVQAALYRAMAEIPGIKVDASARTITGRPAIRCALADRLTELLDDGTGRVSYEMRRLPWAGGVTGVFWLPVVPVAGL